MKVIWSIVFEIDSASVSREMNAGPRWKKRKKLDETSAMSER